MRITDFLKRLKESFVFLKCKLHVYLEIKNSLGKQVASFYSFFFLFLIFTSFKTPQPRLLNVVHICCIVDYIVCYSLLPV